jgi:hypothetical protein
VLVFFSNNLLVWLGICFCISQSAMFSGLNLAFFSITRLRLEIEALSDNSAASKVLRLRADSNFLLTTILWGNVGVNVLLTLLSESVLAGVGAFFFSTFVITFLGEIVPQAYFSRNALKMASFLSPVLKFYQIILYPVAKPSATLLDWWLGPETIQFFKEKSLRHLIRKHVEEDTVDIDRVEGLGALNFLALDDLLVSQEGEPVDPESIIEIPVRLGRPVFPGFERSPDDPFLQRINKSEKKWVIIIDSDKNPRLVMDSDGFLRAALFDDETPDPYRFCHHPVVVRNPRVLLGDVLTQLRQIAETDEDDVIDQDLILLWGTRKHIITGSDILGRLLRGIVKRVRRL